MSKKINYFVVLISFFLVSLLFALVIYLQKPSGFIEGRVQDASGQPLAKARVSADAYPLYLKAFTDDQGYFRLDHVPIGNYHVNIQAKGYQYYYSPKKIEVKEGQWSALGEVKLQETEPNLYLSVPNMTRLPEEKAVLNLSGSRVKEVLLTAYQVNLQNFVEKGGNVYDLSDQRFRPEGNPAFSKIKDWVYSVPEEKVLEFDLRTTAELPNTGVYLIHSAASSLNRQKVFEGNALISKTDIGFIAKRDAKNILLYASHFSSPLPLNNAKVSLYQEGKVQEAFTNPQGLASLSFPASSNANPAPFLIVSQGDQIAFSWAPHYNAEDEGEAGEGEEWIEGEEGASPIQMVSNKAKSKLFLYTERPIYRPAQKVFFKGILRNELSAAAYSLPASQNVHINLQDPQGNILGDQDLPLNTMGSFSGSFDLEDDAALGYYVLRADAGAKSFTQEFEVQEYRKPEFKVEVKPDKDQYYSQDEMRFLISTQYYFGSPVPAKIDYVLYKSSFDEFSYWKESEVPENFWAAQGEAGGYGEVVEEGKAKADEQGNLILKFKAKDEPFGARYTLRVTATDLTERQVVAENDAHVVAGDFYFAPQKTEFFANAKQNFPYTIKTYQYPKNPIPEKFSLSLERETWNEKAALYEHEKVQTLNLQTDAQGLSQTSLLFPEGGYYRIVMAGKDSQGREVKQYDNVWVAGKSEETQDYAIEKKLVVQNDKGDRPYKPGEKIKLLVMSPVANAPLWVTVEGSEIHQSFIQTLQGQSAILELPVEARYTPNVYVTVSLIGKKEYYEQTTEIQLDPADHQLKVELTPSKEKVSPGESVQYHIKTLSPQGQPLPAEISLGVVDESIYALKADSTNINQYFWGPRPNLVGSNYSFSGYLSGGVEKEDRNLLRRNFKDTAYWLAQVMTNAQGEANVELKLPDNLTTWRATAVAHDAQTLVGQKISKIISTKDLVARLATPRFITERDEVSLKAIVQNFSKEKQSLQLSLGVEGLDLLNPQDGQKRNVEIEAQQSYSFEFRVKASHVGEAKFQLLAKNEKISDGLELKIPVLAHGVEDQSYQKGSVLAGNAGESLNREIPLAINPSSDLPKTKLSLSLDTSLLGQSMMALNEMVDYPYGCTEQTSSKLLVAGLAQDLLSRLGQQDPKLEKKVKDFLPRGIRKLQKMQNGDGSWGWWKDEAGNLFMTAYALYTLNEMQLLGNEINPQVFEQGKEALKKLFQEEQKKNPPLENLLFFANYVGQQLNLNLNFRTSPQNIFQNAMALLSLPYLHDDPNQISLETHASCSNETCFYPPLKEGYWVYDQINSSELSAWAIMALSKSNSESVELEGKLALGILSDLKGKFWRHTRETAAALMALRDYALRSQELKHGVNATVSLDAKELEKVNVNNPHFIRHFSNLNLHAGNNLLTLSNDSEGTLYYQTELSQFSQEEDLAPLEAGIKVTKEYLKLEEAGETSEGHKIYRSSPLKGPLKKGEVIGVKLTLRSERDLPYVSLEDPIPTGFEFYEDVQFEEDFLHYSNHQINDEKITFFVGFLEKGERVLTYALRPEMAGNFHVMPAVVRPMYEPEVRGLSREMRVEVK